MSYDHAAYLAAEKRLHEIAVEFAVTVLAATEPLFKRLQAWAVRRDEADQ